MTDKEHKDRITATILRPRNQSVPLDIQGFALRDDALRVMSELADVDGASLKLGGTSDDASVDIGTEASSHFISLWQHDLMAVRFHADGVIRAHGPIIHRDSIRREYHVVSGVRSAIN